MDVVAVAARLLERPSHSSYACAMTRAQGLVGVLAGLLFVGYFLAFIPPNLTAAKDPNMLAAFHVDEWLQYPHVMRMTTGGETASETLTNIFVYQHYFYGFPFYLSSALAILPIRAAAGFAPVAEAIADTTAIMVVLRQLSPLFMLAAVALLVYCWTGFQHLGRTLLVSGLLLAVPGVFDNNLWWHAESLSVLFVAITIFALYRDDLRFDRWFVIAAIACGLAAGTKQVGFWFFLTITVYLAMGMRRDGWGPTWKRGLLFAGLMALTIVAVNPLLLIPTYARQIVDTQLIQARRISFGWDVAIARGPVPWYEQTLRVMFGYWWLYALALAACIWAAVSNGQRRLLAIITLTYVVPFSIYLLFFVGAKPSRYFLPVMLPLLASLGYEALYRWDRQKPWRTVMSSLFVGALLIQIGVFLQRDVASYQASLTRELFSPAVSFNATVEQAFLATLPSGPPKLIYRDPSIYVAPTQAADIVMNWELPTFDYIAELNPDLILLAQTNIRNYANPDFVRNNYRPIQAPLNAAFYAAATADQVPGYRKLFETDYGLALVRQDSQSNN